LTIYHHLDYPHHHYHYHHHRYCYHLYQHHHHHTIPGHDVSVSFGTEINFDDLIEEHEKTHGKFVINSSYVHTEMCVQKCVYI
jgi:hypothetical protein